MLGLGIGIIVVTVLFFLTTSHATAPDSVKVEKEQLTDDEVVERALALGMVSVEDVPESGGTPAGLSDNDVVEKARDLGMLFPEEVVENGEDTSSVSSEGLPDDGGQTDETSDIAEVDAPDETAEEPEPKEYVEFRVFAGMTARSVANLLFEKKIVENSLDFEQYIIEKSATTKIRSGQYRVAKGEAFAEILYLLTTAPKDRKN